MGPRQVRRQLKREVNGKPVISCHEEKEAGTPGDLSREVHSGPMNSMYTTAKRSCNLNLCGRGKKQPFQITAERGTKIALKSCGVLR